MEFSRQLRKTLRREPSAAHRARRFIDQLRESIPAGLFDDVRLLVNEVITNSVRHARDDAGEGITLVVRIGSTSVRVEVCDDGKSFLIAKRPALVLDEGGRGLMILDALADRWGIERGNGTMVWFELHGSLRNSRR